MAVQHHAAVLGKPIAHSLSPALHNAGYAAAGLTGWAYRAIECAEEELPGLLGGLGPDWAGLSLTMPLKEAALAVAGEASPVAVAVGAANTLVRRPSGAWFAENTDVAGMVAVLTDFGVATAPTITVLGAGGTARAALGAAAALRAAGVTVVARRAAARTELGKVGAALGVPVAGADFTHAREHLGADVVISTLPAGVADQLAGWRHWRSETVLFDALYHPWPTPLARSAATAGCRVASGLDLLLAQAVDQFTLFTGVPAPVSAMSEALLAAATARS